MQTGRRELLAAVVGTVGLAGCADLEGTRGDDREPYGVDDPLPSEIEEGIDAIPGLAESVIYDPTALVAASREAIAGEPHGEVFDRDVTASDGRRVENLELSRRTDGAARELISRQEPLTGEFRAIESWRDDDAGLAVTRRSETLDEHEYLEGQHVEMVEERELVDLLTGIGEVNVDPIDSEGTLFAVRTTALTADGPFDPDEPFGLEMRLEETGRIYHLAVTGTIRDTLERHRVTYTTSFVVSENLESPDWLEEAVETLGIDGG